MVCAYLCNRGPKKGPAATETVGNEDEEDGASSDLDDTVDTRCEKTGGVTDYTEVLENLWSVVVDSVRA